MSNRNMTIEVEKLKMAIIAGASHAARHMAKNPRANESEVVKEVTKQTDAILEKIDEEFK
jgi:hypothetical protein